MTGDIVDADIRVVSGDPVSGNPRTVPFQYDFRDLYTNIMEGHLGVSEVAKNIFPDRQFTPSPNDFDLV